MKSRFTVGLFCLALAVHGLVWAGACTDPLAFVKDALARGEKRIVVPKGQYELTTEERVFFRFDGVTNVVVDFSGSKLIFKRRTRMFHLLRCANVTVRNAVLDMDPLPFVQAVIEKVENPGAVWTVRVLDGYDSPFTENTWPCQVYDGKTFETKTWMRLGADFKIEPLGGRRYRISGGSSESAGDVGDICVWTAYEPGKPALSFGDLGTRATDGRPWARVGIHIDYSTNCTIENMTLYAAAGVGMQEFCSSGNVWRNCRLDRCPPEEDIRTREVRRVRSGTHDGFNSRMCNKGPVLENCTFAYHCDDAVNICGHYGVVSEVNGRTARILFKSSWCPLGLVQKGDTLEIMTADGVCKTADPRVLEVTPDVPRTEAELAWFKTLGFWPGQELVVDSGCRVVLDLAGTLEKGDIVVSAQAQGSGFVLKNCTLGPNRVYGTRIRASNGLIENCTFDHTQGSAVFIGPEYAWLEGGYGNDIVFKNNRYIGCGGAELIHVGGVASNMRWIPASAHRNIVPDRPRPWANAEELGMFHGYLNDAIVTNAEGYLVRRFYKNAAKTEWIDCNYDERAVKPYKLDDPFTFLDGRKVASQADWQARRKEILGLFQTEVYGRLPPPPEKIVVEKTSEKTTGDGFTIERRYRLWFRADKTGPVIDWVVILPRFAKGKVPVFLHLNYFGNDVVASGRTNHFTFPFEHLCARGYAFMSARYTQISADPHTKNDWDNTAYNGVFELWGQRDPKKTDNTSVLMAWAWGLMRGLDLAERIPEIDAKKSVVIGSSRLGKAALLAAAYDERFAVCIPNQTGAVGVQVMKRDFGENAKMQEVFFPHWYCKGFWKYRDDPSKQPFDQHLLLACVAPRAMLLECYQDKWFDPEGEYVAAKAAQPVWRFLAKDEKGARGMTALPEKKPAPFDTTYAKPPFGHVSREEEHGLSSYDWMWALDFADQVFKIQRCTHAVVSFKDAAKLKSWDAWDDHKAHVAVTNLLQRERPCVTWKKLNQLDFGLEEIGRLATRTSAEISGSKWSVGCETMDRDYAEWDNFKHLLPLLGVKRARFFSGWAKTEQQKGVYDFAWLDRHIRECAAMKIKPWVCISYGNPVYGSDFRLGMRVKQVTGNPEAFAAWLRYTKALVARYRDVVDEWEIWNEPFDQAADYAELFYHTAKAVREIQPAAKIICTSIGMQRDMTKSDYAVVLEKLKRENALDLASRFSYHPYEPNPDKAYEATDDWFGWQMAIPLRAFVKSYSGKYDILQGETGCPGQLEFGHALLNIEWTEYSQAKWDLRRAIGDAARDIPSCVFTMIDLQYTFMLQSFGLVRSNTLKEFIYRRPKWYAMRNVYSLFDDDMRPQGLTKAQAEITRRADPRDTAVRTLTRASFARYGNDYHLFWYSDQIPSNRLEFDRVTVRVPGKLYRSWRGSDVAWVDMITGRIGRIDPKNVSYDEKKDETAITDVPMWDSPVLIANRASLQLALDWKTATAFEIVDTFYRPGEKNMYMKAFPGPHTNEPWLAMSNAEFLPCFDKYGQFKHREWPGKTHCDADLKAAADAEAKDLAAHPGPADRDTFGGWKKGPKFEATGRFYVKKVNGKWWFVDPEGYLYWSFGPVRVTASSAMTPLNGYQSGIRGFARPDRDCLFTDLPPEPGAADATAFSKFWTTYDHLLLPFFRARGETRVYDLSSANLYRKYGADYYKTYSDLVHRRLRSWGANTIANSSDIQICLMDRTPYAERVETHSAPIAGSWGPWGKFRDPWDKTFKPAIAEALTAHGREAHDPWCLGFFIDNEILWGSRATDLARWTLQSPANQPAKVQCVAFLKGKYATVAALNAAWGASYADWDDLAHSTLLPGAKAKDDLELFTRAIVEEYFKRTREAVKAFDKDLLYLGCRFAGCPPWVFDAAAKYCDVLSWNIYATTLDAWKLPKEVDAPVLCGEFHFGATDRGPFGTGVIVAKDQNDRAAKMKRYVESALRHPLLVGVHWHQFSDQATSGRFDGEGLQVGWTDICDTPYPIMRQALREVAYPLYATRAAAR